MADPVLTDDTFRKVFRDDARDAGFAAQLDLIRRSPTLIEMINKFAGQGRRVVLGRPGGGTFFNGRDIVFDPGTIAQQANPLPYGTP